MKAVSVAEYVNQAREQAGYMNFLVDLLFPRYKKQFSDAQKLLDINVDWDLLFMLAERDRVLSPVLTRLMDIFRSKPDDDQKRLVREKLNECHKRSKEALRLISKVQNALTRNKIEFVVFKTFDDYPNIPSEDIDILVQKEEIEKAEDTLFNLEVRPYLYEKGPLAYLGETPEKRHFHFKVKNLLFEVELYPELTVLGEEYISVGEIIRNLRKATFDGQTISLPSHEDALLITFVHALFKHGGLIRLSDIYNVTRLIKEEDLNWNYILATSYEKGVTVGLIYTLRLIDDFYFERCNESLLPKYVIRYIDLRFNLEKPPKINEVPYRIPILTLFSFFMYKTLFDACKLRWYSALKTFQACVFKTVGRVLYLILRSTHKYSSLKRWGWYESVKLYG